MAINFSRQRATTPIDYCVCHLWSARITLQIYMPPDPEKCFQLPLAGVNPLCWADWNGTRQTLDKATKLHPCATAAVTAIANAINNIKVWEAQEHLSAALAWNSECRWFSRGFLEELWCSEMHEILSPCSLGMCFLDSDGLKVMFTAESHMTAKAEFGRLVEMGRLSLNDPEGQWFVSMASRALATPWNVQCFGCSVFGEIFFKKQWHV